MSRSAELLVISPASGPTRTRTRLPIVTREIDRRSDVVHGRIIGSGTRDGDLPGMNRESDAARADVARPRLAAHVERDPREPTRTRLRHAVQQCRPGELRDERIGG